MAGEKKKSALGDLIAELNKKRHSRSVLDLSKPTDCIGTDVETLTTGLPSLDLILGGGFPVGRIVEIYGPESSGKSTMALHCLSKCLTGDKKAVYVDVESAFDIEYAKKLGVNIDRLILTQPDTGEEALGDVERFAATGEVSVIVVDSVAALVTAADMDKELDAVAGMAGKARLLSRACPRIANIAKKNNCTVIFINQIRMNIGISYGNPEVTTGGMGLKYAASVRMCVRARKAEERNGREGQPVYVKIQKNKIASPFRTTELFLQFGVGFEVLDDLVDVAVSKGIIKKGGAWFNFAFWDEELKYQGKSSLTDYLMKNDNIKKKLEHCVKTGEIKEFSSKK